MSLFFLSIKVGYCCVINENENPFLVLIDSHFSHEMQKFLKNGDSWIIAYVPATQ